MVHVSWQSAEVFHMKYCSITAGLHFWDSVASLCFSVWYGNFESSVGLMKQGSVSWRRGTLLPSLRSVWMSTSDLTCGKSTSHELRSPLFETLTLLTVYLYKMSCLSFPKTVLYFSLKLSHYCRSKIESLSYRNDTPSIFTVWDSI